MAKQRLAVIISLEERRQRIAQDNLREENRRMIEAEHALFVALRLAGHKGQETPALTGRRAPSKPALAPVVPLRPRRKRAA